jgi:hypothetical protein
MEPDNKTDPMAIAVKRTNGSQLGYLDKRIASQLHQDAGKPVSWSAITSTQTDIRRRKKLLERQSF